jgi:hypothetical protein
MAFPHFRRPAESRLANQMESPSFSHMLLTAECAGLQNFSLLLGTEADLFIYFFA